MSDNELLQAINENLLALLEWVRAILGVLLAMLAAYGLDRLFAAK